MYIDRTYTRVVNRGCREVVPNDADTVGSEILTPQTQPCKMYFLFFLLYIVIST